MVCVEVCFVQWLTLTLTFQAVVMVFVEGCFAQRLTLTLTFQDGGGGEQQAAGDEQFRHDALDPLTPRHQSH